MTPRIDRWAVPVVLALAIVGCGGGDEGTAEPTSAPTAVASAPSADVSEPAASEGASGGEQTYVVKSGDTLSAIAEQFDTTVEAIVEANDIADPDVIDVGDEFEIPSGP